MSDQLGDAAEGDAPDLDADAEGYFQEQEIRDMARVFSMENSYEIGGRWAWAKFTPDQIVALVRAAATYVQAPADPRPEPLPHPGSPEADKMLDMLLAEYGHPANMKNAARAGYMAARRLLQWARQPLPDSSAQPKGTVSAQVADELDRIAQEPPISGNTVAQARVMLSAAEVRAEAGLTYTPPHIGPDLRSAANYAIAMLERTTHATDAERLSAAETLRSALGEWRPLRDSLPAQAVQAPAPAPALTEMQIDKLLHALDDVALNFGDDLPGLALNSRGLERSREVVRRAFASPAVAPAPGIEACPKGLSVEPGPEGEASSIHHAAIGEAKP